jgi:glycerophosphoryl diester phosphodiesterase
MIDEYKAAGFSPKRVFAQSFNLNDVLYWLAEEPKFGKQAVYLDSRVDTAAGYAAAVAGMNDLVAKGVKIVAPPMFALVKLDGSNNIVPSEYGVAAWHAGLDIITWTIERSGFLKTGGGYYYSSVKNAINNDGDMLTMLDVLARKVGIRGIFSDWPATVTYYATCMGL